MAALAVDRLGVLPGGRPGGGVAHVAHRALAGERPQLRLVEHLRDEAEVAHGHDVAVLGGRDAGRLLAAVLECVQAEVGETGDVGVRRVHAEDATLVARSVAEGIRIRVGGTREVQENLAGMPLSKAVTRSATGTESLAAGPAATSRSPPTSPSLRNPLSAAISANLSIDAKGPGDDHAARPLAEQHALGSRARPARPGRPRCSTPPAPRRGRPPRRRAPTPRGRIAPPRAPRRGRAPGARGRPPAAESAGAPDSFSSSDPSGDGSNGPSRAIASPSCAKPLAGTRSGSGSQPTMPTTGVGKIGPSSPSL